MSHKLLLNRCSFSYKARHTQIVCFAGSTICFESNLHKFILHSHAHGQCIIHKNITSLARSKGNECVSHETKKKHAGFLEVTTITKETGFLSENLHMRAWALMCNLQLHARSRA